jgi:uncharacterized membrane protein
MTPEERLDQLERRIAVLERLVREIAGQLQPQPRAEAGPRPVRAEAAAPVAPAASPREPAGEPAGDPAAPEPPYVIPPTLDAPPVAPPRRRPAAASAGAFAALGERLGTEEWLGQKALLGVGVTAIVLAMGYLLKLSFDRNWIPPVLRCIGGVAVGVGIGALGWRLHPRYRTYGAALVGCGAAVVYLAVWAASRLYGIMPPTPAIVGLALVAAALAAIAFAIDVQALGSAAALGALLAPVVIGRDASQGDLLLVYLACMSAGLGWVAAVRRWRLTMLLVAAGFFGVGGTGGAEDADAAALVLYGALGGAAGLVVGLRERWWETRFLAFSGGWALLGLGGDRLAAELLLVPAALALAAPVWMHALGDPRPWRERGAELLYFFATPLLLAWPLREQAPEFFDRHPEVAAVVVGAPYLVAGFQRPRIGFAVVGVAAAGLAAWLAWPGIEAVWALIGLALVWAALGRALGRDDARGYAVATLFVALYHLYAADVARRPAEEAAFVGAWALALWGSALAAAGLATWAWRRAEWGAERVAQQRQLLWGGAGLLVFFGVTAELGRHFGGAAYQPAVGEFARGLAVTVWWLFAGAVLVALGSSRVARALRIGGFLALAGALYYLVFVALNTRLADDPAFWGWWAAVFWLSIATVGGLATMLGRWAASAGARDPATRALWLVTGALVLLGVTGELGRYFGGGAPAGSEAALAGGLAISAWWLVFAAALVGLGFRRGHTGVRRAGLAVAALAAAKVTLSDLSSLDALYRIGSVLILGIVFLSLAYLYHRQARTAPRAPADEAVPEHAEAP